MRKLTIASIFGGVCTMAAIVVAQQRPAAPRPPVAPSAPVAPVAPGPTTAPATPTAPAAAVGKAAPATPRNSAPATAAAPAAANPDEAVIRRSADAFVKAYDAKDAAAIAALFTPEGVLFDAQGAAQQGREVIAGVFADVFAQHPEAKMQIKIESILFATPALAIEAGTTSVVHEPGDAPERLRYSVTHVKQSNGKWLMACARDLEDEEGTAASELEQLGWLVGEWVDESAEGLIKTSYAWNESHTFLVSEYTLHVAGNRAMSGSQRIGWDPLSDQIRSWVFDSDGGFGDGLWSRDKNRWIVKLTGVTRDGKIGSATQVFTRVNDHKYTFESRDRLVGGEAAPDVEPVSVVRSPPGPQAKAKAAPEK